MGAQHISQERRLPDGLTVSTVSVADPGDLLSRLPSPAVSAWIHQGDGLVGWGEAARLTIPAGEDRFAAGEKWLAELFDAARVEDEVGVPGTGPVAFGSFTFDPASDGSVLIVPAVITGRRSGRGLADDDHRGRSEPQRPPTALASPAEMRWSDGSLTAPQWEQVVAAAVARIKAGELRKVVLARDLQAYASADIDVRVLLARLAARSPGCYTFACAGLVGATPELLIQREGRDVRSLVLAGTMARGGSQADDEALSAALLGSAKNAEEHRYSVESVLDLLAPLCAELEVDPEPLPAPDGRLPAPGDLGVGRAHPRHVGARARGVAASHRRHLRHADRGGPGAHQGARADGPRSLLGSGWLGRRPRQWRVGHRAALRRDRREAGQAVRGLRHRGRLAARIRARRDRDQVPAHAPRARGLILLAAPVLPA